jgi:hypothetical protein
LFEDSDEEEPPVPQVTKPVAPPKRSAPSSGKKTMFDDSDSSADGKRVARGLPTTKLPPKKKSMFDDSASEEDPKPKKAAGKVVSKKPIAVKKKSMFDDSD